MKGPHGGQERGYLGDGRTGRNRLGGGEETAGGDNDNIGARIGGQGRRGIKRGLGGERVISGSERVRWSGMEQGERVITLDRRRAGNMTGRDDIVAKTQT